MEKTLVKILKDLQIVYSTGYFSVLILHDLSITQDTGN